MNNKMAINVYLSTIESKKKNIINEQAEQKVSQIQRTFWQLPEGRGRVRGMGEKVKGLGSTNWLLQNSHRDVKYSIGNVVNNILITMYGVSWV